MFLGNTCDNVTSYSDLGYPFLQQIPLYSFPLPFSVQLNPTGDFSSNPSATGASVGGQGDRYTNSIDKDSIVNKTLNFPPRQLYRTETFV